MNRPLISIVIPIYNVEEFLGCCIQSVLRQSYHNLDIILVDDGSTDRSTEICDFYSKKDYRVRVFHQRNAGAAAARNNGINHAKGEFILFVDGDDYIHPEMIEKLYNASLCSNTDMAMCGFVCVGEKEESYQACNKSKEKHTSSGLISENDYWHRYYTSPDVAYIAVWNKLVRRSVYSEKIRFTEGKRIDDEFIIHKIVAVCHGIACIEENLYCYRKRQGSAMNTSINIGHLDVVEARIERAKFFCERGLQFFSEKSVTFALSDLVDGKYKLDLKSAESRERYRELRQMCIKEGRKVFLKASNQYKVVFSLFLLGDCVYKLGAEFIRKRKRRKIYR